MNIKYNVIGRLRKMKQLAQLGKAAKDFLSSIITNMLSRKPIAMKQFYRKTNGKHANYLDCSGERFLSFFLFFFPPLTDLLAEISTSVCHMMLNMKILSGLVST